MKKKVIGGRMKKLLCGVLVLLTCLFCLCGCKSKEQKEWEQFLAQYKVAKREIYLDENEKYADYEVDVAFLGDSLTDMYDVKAHYPDLTVVNRGVGGDTTFDLEARLDYSVYELKPKVAVMLIGANNFSTMLENYESILIGLKENLPNTRIVLLSLTSMSGETWGIHNELAAYNNVRIKLLAEKHGLTFVDLYSPLMDPETGELRTEYSLDGGHLCEAGYDVLTRVITPVLNEELALWTEQNTPEEAKGRA